MPWTKRDVVLKAYEELGRAGYEFDLNADDLQTGLSTLDLMALEWSVAGIRIGYSGGDGMGSIDANAEVPAWACSALYYNLACRLAASLGKTPMPTTVAYSKASYDNLQTQMLKPAVMQPSGYMGSGGQRWKTQAVIPTTPDELEFLDGN